MRTSCSDAVGERDQRESRYRAAPDIAPKIGLRDGNAVSIQPLDRK
jgi:hypothetical protein